MQCRLEGEDKEIPEDEFMLTPQYGWVHMGPPEDRFREFHTTLGDPIDPGTIEGPFRRLPDLPDDLAGEKGQ